MLYDFPETSANLRQGDIFINLPKVQLDLSEFPLLEDDDSISRSPWKDVVENKKEITGVLGIITVAAIVISQDCDAAREEEITLCEIKGLTDIESWFEGKTSQKKIVDTLMKKTRQNPKWFYLPQDPKIGFEHKMAVDFRSTLSVYREDLELLKFLRKGRLNEIGYQHFREKLSNFYHRYAYNEWYSLTKNEVKDYNHYASLTAKDLYKWQK